MTRQAEEHFCFSVWDQHTNFLKDRKFQDAYEFGLNSGHRYGRMPQEWQFYIACCLASHALHLDGDFVECGVNTGRMSLTICKYINFNSIDKNFYLFDTYCGMPEYQILESEREYALDYNKQWYPDVYELTKTNFSPFTRAIPVRGIVPDTLASVPIEAVCYLHLDMNIVAPEIAALRFFWDKLSRGAVVLLDDYNFERHILQKQEMDAFAKEQGTKVIPLPTCQGLIIKF